MVSDIWKRIEASLRCTVGPLELNSSSHKTLPNDEGLLPGQHKSEYFLFPFIIDLLKQYFEHLFSWYFLISRCNENDVMKMNLRKRHNSQFKVSKDYVGTVLN